MLVSFIDDNGESQCCQWYILGRMIISSFISLFICNYCIISLHLKQKEIISFGFQIVAQSTNNHDLMHIFTVYDVNILTVSHIFSKIGRRFSSPRGISRLLEALKDRKQTLEHTLKLQNRDISATLHKY
jgi:hypothetical protein